MNIRTNKIGNQKIAKKDMLTIVEISACGCKQAQRKLKCHVSMDERISILLKEVVRLEHFDIISVRDIPWHALRRIQRELQYEGYTMHIHRYWPDEQNKWRYTCLSAIFVSEDVNYQQIDIEEDFPTIYRYVAGKISFAGSIIYWRTSHIPCVGRSTHVELQTERKRSMLINEIQFQKRCQEELLALSTGDFNGCASDHYSYACKEQYLKFAFADMISVPTYGKFQLDHVFISPKLQESNDISVTTECLQNFDHYTDHLLVIIKLEAAC